MYIESVTLQNFRCFGQTPTRITFVPDVTVLIGTNGTGKSTLIEALRRLFGITREERTLTQSDIHFGPDEVPEEVAERQVVIDVVFSFPEINDQDDRAATRTIPEVFRVMTAEAPGSPLKVRLRLEAVWRRGESYSDDIESSLYWISHLNDVEFGDEGVARLDKQPVHSTDRGKIQLVYIPATRDGNAVTRQALRQLLIRLEKSGDFGADTEEEIQEISDSLQESIDALPAITWITERLQANWNRLHTAAHLSKPKLTVISQEFLKILRSLTAKLAPSHDGREKSIEELSEGQSSLFFLALAATVSQLEKRLAEPPVPGGFAELDTSPPALTIYALEEPENHLAPFYLSRLMALIHELCDGPQGMGIVTTHSTGIVRRVQPESIRHMRLDTEHLITHVNEIDLPESGDEDNSEIEKFIRQAVISQPEIYFAKLVILGEGDSEEIVIPTVAKALRVDLDPSFIAFAPLGGRHVNHFWRLLSTLDIPFITLLDFDLGRHKAGPLRLKYAYNQLQKISTITVPDWVEGNLRTSAYWNGLNDDGINQWITWFAERNIFFSYPLDLDLMMIQAYPEAYGVSDDEEPDDEEKLLSSVFGEGDGLEAYEQNPPSIQELQLYDSQFKKRSKPASHLAALSSLSEEEIRGDCPHVLQSLIERAEELIQEPDPEEGE